MSEWSSYQEAIFANITSGKGHTVAIARAGSGKTTTILEGLKHVPPQKSVLMVAFNKKIEQELSRRAPNGVEVKTLHGYGYQQIRSAFPKVKLDKYKVQNIVKDLIGEECWPAIMGACKAVSLAKSCFVGLVLSMQHEKELAVAMAQIDDLIDSYEIQIGWEPDKRPLFVKMVVDTLLRSKLEKDVIDFDDMIWFPLVHSLRLWQYDRVFIDETQDLNPSQIELALRSCKTGGRIFAVGDDRQAIYGFRGADENAVNNVIHRLNAKTMKLTVCYRCASSIVAEAAKTVPDFEPSPGAIKGLVTRDVSETEMRKGVAPGDFVLSRTNAPLVSLCWTLIRDGQPATIQGRDFAGSLIGMIAKARKSTVMTAKGSVKVKTVEDFLDWLDDWQSSETKRLMLKKKDTTSVEDKTQCLQALCDGCLSLDEVVAKTERLFWDVDDDLKRIVLSSTHKAKGLERNRVWVLQDTYRKRPGIQEENLWYVAITRARAELFLVTGVGGPVRKKWAVKKEETHVATGEGDPKVESSFIQEHIEFAYIGDAGKEHKPAQLTTDDLIRNLPRGTKIKEVK